MDLSRKDKKVILLLGRSKLPLLAFLFLPFSSCFEIIQEIDLEKDGSGHLEVVLNLSRSKTNIGILLTLDEVNGHNVPTLKEVDQKFNNFLDSARTSTGISNVSGEFDQQHYIFQFSCDFDRIERLNSRVYELAKKKDSTATYHQYWSYKDNRLDQHFSVQMIEAFRKMSRADQEILIGADYTAIFRFKSAVIANSNKFATIAPNKKVVILQSPVMELIHQPGRVNHSIQLK